MSRVSVDTDLLDGLADSISNKFDESVPLTITEMTGVVNDILVRTGSNVTVSGATISVQSGLYKANVSKTVASGTEGIPTASKGTVSNHSISVTPSVTNSAGYISGSTKTGTAVTVTASELASGNKAITNNGTNIDVIGYSTVSVDVGPLVNNQTKTATPSEAQKVITYDSGYTGLEQVTISAISSTYVGSGITRRSSSDMTFGFYGGSMPYIGAPAGYYASDSMKMIPRGTEGTPVATKGTVSNHSIDITPSVTNSDGYIIGSTKTGTAVTVTAAELASGTKSITSNGTGIDVVGYSTVDVAVPAQAINNQNKTVTPTTSAQIVTADTGYTGLGIVAVKAIASGTLGTPTWTRLPNSITSPTALRIRAQATELGGFVPGYFDSFDVYTELAYETKTVTPSTSQQTVSPTNTSKYMNQVIVEPIPSQYIVPTGTFTITQNGTYNVSSYASVVINVTPVQTYLATITVTNSAGNSFVEYDGTQYNGDGDTFDFIPGETLFMSSYPNVGQVRVARVYVNGEQVAIAQNTGSPVTYEYILPSTNMSIEMNIQQVNVSYYISNVSVTETGG